MKPGSTSPPSRRVVFAERLRAGMPYGTTDRPRRRVGDPDHARAVLQILVDLRVDFGGFVVGRDDFDRQIGTPATYFRDRHRRHARFGDETHIRRKDRVFADLASV